MDLAVRYTRTGWPTHLVTPGLRRGLSEVFWPTRFVSSLTNTLVNRFLPATVPERTPVELENRPSSHPEVASAHGLEPYARSESPPVGRLAQHSQTTGL